jgi:DNA-binding NarL/FixJ family response regulator
MPNGYIVKPFDEKDILVALEIALFNARSNLQSSRMEKSNIERNHSLRLTEREYVTLIDLTQGLTNAQIADKQYVSINTVKTHLKNIYTKFEVTDRVNLVKCILS